MRRRKSNCAQLNNIYRAKPFKDFGELLDMSRNAPSLIREMYYKENPEIRELSKTIEVKIILPSHLLHLERLLQSVTQSLQKNVKFVKDCWVSDSEAIESYCNQKLRRFADSPEEVSRWEFANKFADFVNNEIRPGYYATQKFKGDILTGKSGSDKLFPDWRFVKAEFTN